MRLPYVQRFARGARPRGSAHEDARCAGNGQGSNSYLPQALQAVSMYGFGAVAVWPSGGDLNSSGVPQGGSWYSDFAQFLGH
jgi:hypothetical protein